MRVEMKKLILILILLSSTILFQSCSKDKVKENLNVGKLEVYCDANLFPLLKEPMELYAKTYPDVKFTYKLVSAREAMRLLLSGNAKAVIIGRDYLKDEDSLMKAFKVNRLQIKFGKDGLVFFTKAGFPIDSMNVKQIYSWLTDKNYSLKTQFPNLNFEPELVTTDVNSSVYANFKSLAAENGKIVRKIKIFDDMEQVKNYVKSNPQAIGVGFLSHVYENADFASIRLGYNHKDGKREVPQIVHPSWVVMDRYPYIADYYIYVTSDLNDLPNYFATFIQKNADVQKYIFSKGVVPEHAKINLLMQ
jgi:ABC-type phosphate transport system substrate-binding protein